MNEVAKLESGNELRLPTAALGAQELFVINLCASMTPMPAVPKNLKGFEKYKLYQVSRQEDGRRRFRLRLGFFTSEADAEWVLNSVRSLYPAAFTGCVSAEDLRYTGEAIPATPRAPIPSAAVAQPSSAPVARPVIAQSASVTTPPKTATAAKAAPVAKSTNPAVAAPAAARKPAAPASVVAPTPDKPAALTASTPAVTPQQATAPQSHSQPFHVGRGVDIPDIQLELTDEYEIPPPLTKQTKAPANQPASQPAASAARPATQQTPAPSAAVSKPANNAQRSEAPIRSASIISPPKVVDDYVPILDTTLTIRTLTKTEAEDPNRPKWFAVQLALSEQPINLDTMPKLDIFAAYTLYSVASMEGGTIKHALRLGFFKENVSAEAVMGYLKAFFNTPSINQISSAEFERFSDPKPKPKPVPEPESKVIELGSKRPVTPIKPMASAATSQAAKPTGKPASGSKPTTTYNSAPPRPQSFLSRLIGRQLD